MMHKLKHESWLAKSSSGDEKRMYVWYCICGHILEHEAGLAQKHESAIALFIQHLRQVSEWKQAYKDAWGL